MWIARSTSPPAGAGPSATSSGSIPRAWAIAGKHRIATSRSNRFSIETPLAVHRALVEIRAKPALGLFDGCTPAFGVILELVAADARHSEILAVAVAEIKTRHRRCREHREILGQRNLARIAAEHLEQHRLQAVIGAGRIARRRPDAFVFLADQLRV